MKNFARVFFLLILFSVGFINRSCNCIIIQDMGNPARFIRGTFLDVDRPEFFGSSISNEEAKNFHVQDSVPTLMGNTIKYLDNFNKAMINPTKIEAEKLDAASTVNTCRFSRARLTAMNIKNTLESQLVKIAQANLSEDPNILNFDLSESDLSEIVADFQKVEEDLHPFDEAIHGKEAMIQFTKALTNLDSLRLLLSSTQE